MKSAPKKAFQYSIGRNRSRTYNADAEDDGISMPALETIVDSLLEIMEVEFSFSYLAPKCAKIPSSLINLLDHHKLT